ncbi:hypothetical protein ACO0QE_001445 [Hanseniaspora vineae]
MKIPNNNKNINCSNNNNGNNNKNNNIQILSSVVSDTEDDAYQERTNFYGGNGVCVSDSTNKHKHTFSEHPAPKLSKPSTNTSMWILYFALLPALCKAFPIFGHNTMNDVQTISAVSTIKTAAAAAESASPHTGEKNFVAYLLVAMLLIVLGGIFAGLTLGIMGQDEVYLKVISVSGTARERKASLKILELLNRGKHWVLVTLLLSNVITNETLPIVLDRIAGGGWQAVLGSTVSIVIFGEIIPQSVCVRYGLEIGAFFQPFILVLMYIMYPVVKPISIILDMALGESHGTVYKKNGLKTLVTLHNSESMLGVEEPLTGDEVTIISAVLDLKDKQVQEIMTPLENVFTLSCDTVLNEEKVDEILNSGFSRIPIHVPNKPLDFIGMLLVRILISYDPEDCWKISDFPLATLPETGPTTSCLNILNYFQEGKSHMCIVSENPGFSQGAIGVLTLEDVIEELIGEEIVDESDVLRNSPLATMNNTDQVSNGQHTNSGSDGNLLLAQSNTETRKNSVSSFKKSLSTVKSRLNKNKSLPRKQKNLKRQSIDHINTVHASDHDHSDHEESGFKPQTTTTIITTEVPDDTNNTTDKIVHIVSPEAKENTPLLTVQHENSAVSPMPTAQPGSPPPDFCTASHLGKTTALGPQPLNRASDPLKVNKNFVTIKQLPKEFAQRQTHNLQHLNASSIYLDSNTSDHQTHQARSTQKHASSMSPRITINSPPNSPHPQPEPLQETHPAVSVVLPHVDPETYNNPQEFHNEFVASTNYNLNSTLNSRNNHSSSPSYIGSSSTSPMVINPHSHFQKRSESHGGIVESVITVEGVTKTIIEQAVVGSLGRLVGEKKGTSENKKGKKSKSKKGKNKKSKKKNTIASDAANVSVVTSNEDNGRRSRYSNGSDDNDNDSDESSDSADTENNDTSNSTTSEEGSANKKSEDEGTVKKVLGKFRRLSHVSGEGINDNSTNGTTTPVVGGNITYLSSSANSAPKSSSRRSSSNKGKPNEESYQMT